MTYKKCLIEVTEFRAISSDSNQWMLMKRNKKLDKETKQPIGGYTEWVSYSYPATFKQACAALEAELQRMCGATTFTELMRSSERIHAMMLETLERAELPAIPR